MVTKNKYIISLAVLLVLGTSSFELGKHYSKNNSQPEEKTVAATTAKPGSVETVNNTADTKTTTQKQNVKTNEPAQTVSTQSNTGDQKSEQIWGTIKDLAAKQGVTAEEATNNKIYNVKQPIRISKNMFVTLEGFRSVVTEASFAEQKYYVVADISIVNTSRENYYSSISNFTLEDNYGYTYAPSKIVEQNGSIEGEINSGNIMKRGEIAFEVPGRPLVGTLIFNTQNIPENKNNIQSIRFRINITTLNKGQ